MPYYYDIPTIELLISLCLAVSTTKTGKEMTIKVVLLCIEDIICKVISLMSERFVFIFEVESFNTHSDDKRILAYSEAILIY